VASTFLFADIAGYTALTEAHGDEDAAELAHTFCRAVGEIASAEEGELVKTIGDAVMVRHTDPARAVALGLRAAGEVLAGHGFPTVRVGMHHGPALESEGDWFGSTVNLAARVAALAAGGEVLLTEAVREAAGELEDVTPPEEAEAANAQIAAGLRLYAGELDRLRNAAERGDQPTIDDFNNRIAQLESVRQIMAAAESLKFKGYDLGPIAEE
jgi:class 3 adenylate cyclase